MMNRREFLGTSLGAGATLALTPELLLGALQPSGGTLVQRAIPSSGERLPVISYGARSAIRRKPDSLRTRWGGSGNGTASPATAEVPTDLQAALDARPAAKAFFETLTGQNRFAILFRIQDAKRPETRARRIAQFVEMLKNGETLH